MSASIVATYRQPIHDYVQTVHEQLYREPGGIFAYPFIVPGTKAYSDALWDWDSWLTTVALRQAVHDRDDPEATARARAYARGCVLNYLHWGDMDGWIPIEVTRTMTLEHVKPQDILSNNMHKPMLAQHAAFLVQQDGGDAEWLRERFAILQAFVLNYYHHHRHATGLYYWQTDERIGVDNDPATFYRPPRSSGSIFLNTLMVKELDAMVYLCEQLDLRAVGDTFRRAGEHLRQAIQTHCWDERDGFFYSVDFNLMPIDASHWLHSGAPRTWDSLLQRIGSWTGFLPLWAGIATPEQAERIVAEHYRNERTFHAPYGVRSLSRLEKMYQLTASSNPSNWLGPIWGISNYLVFRGLVRYGYRDDARELAEATVRLFGEDLARTGDMHEFYLPDNGEPVMNGGFQSWNLLVVNMLAWLEDRPVIAEFS